MRRILVRSACVLFGVALALAALEAALWQGGASPLQRNPLSGFHVPDSELGWVGARTYAARFRHADFDVVIASDADGFRRPAHGVEPHADAPEVVFVGDSFTWGWGVPQGAVFTDRLQADLGPAVRVTNRGVNAYSTGQERLLLERVVAERAPAVAVLVFYRNDLADSEDPKGGRRPWYRLDGDALVLENSPVARDVTSALRDLTRRSRAFSMLRYETNRFAERMKAERRDEVLAAGAPSGPTDADMERRWAIARGLLLEARDVCAAAGVELRVVYATANYDLTHPDIAPPARGAIRQRLAVECAELGVPLLDPTDAFVAAWRAAPDRGDAGEPLFFAGDEHWTVAGHALFAHELELRWTWPRGD